MPVAARPEFAIEPIRTSRTFEAAIEHLTEAVERSRLRAGDRLPNEGDLAAKLGISKPTLRQALRVLELSGMLTVRRGKSGGIFLATDVISPVAVSTAVRLEESAAIDALHARRVLERAVAVEAAAVATPRDYEELERTIALLERHLGERPVVMRVDAMFHRALVRACHNTTIEGAMRGVARGLAPIRDAYPGGAERDSETLDVHRDQLAAMRDGDTSALEHVLDRHFRMLESSFAEGIGRSAQDLFARGL